MKKEHVAKMPPKSAPSKAGRWVSEDEFSQLHRSLTEAQETLDAIRSGAVDAVVVQGPHGNQVFSLTSAEQPYRIYVERMQEGAVTISHDGIILFANRRFADMTGKRLEQVIGADIASYLESDDCEKLRAAFANHHETVKHQTVLKGSKEYGLPVYLTASHLPLQDQNVLCLVVTDLSAQKHIEELRLAKEAAERANNAKDDFLAALSHELRTPLNPVLLLASEGAEDQDLPQRARADFATIRDNIELEARLIDDLLDLNRIAHGKVALERKPVDCHAVLDNAIAIVEPEFRRKKIALAVNFEKAPCKLNGDRIRLQQVFWNVLKNAAKFTPEKGRVNVSACITSDRRNWTVTISDTGIGMTPEELENIFEAFVQGKHATKSGSHLFGGLGLGLSISQTLVRMHQGSIHAHSDGPGRGATFTLQLPLRA